MVSPNVAKRLLRYQEISLGEHVFHTYAPSIDYSSLFRRYLLQLLGTVHKIVGIRLGDDPPLIRLLHKILVALFLRESYCIFLALEVQMCALQEIGR